MPFQMPESDVLPEARNIADVFPPHRESAVVQLAVPDYRLNGINCLPAEEAATRNGVRFAAEPRMVGDETSAMDEKPVRVGRKNVRVLLDSEPAEGLTVLPLARIARNRSGNFVYEENFIPPCLQIGGSEALMLLLHRLVDILDDKSSSLGRGTASSLHEFSTREIANFWFLHTVNTAIPGLRHLMTGRRCHPEELYSAMAQLAGALCTFTVDSHPSSVPRYDHHDLTGTFTALDEHIRRHLETVVPSNCLSIPLSKSAEYFWTGEVTDTRCLGPSRWILALRSEIGEVELISRTPQLVKVCSRLFVPELVRRALPGMSLAHLPLPPSAVSARIDTQYFAINRAGPCHDHIRQTRQVGLYIPGEIPDPEPELLVVLDDRGTS
jgi:type VI secretion system protein ImpJ